MSKFLSHRNLNARYSTQREAVYSSIDGRLQPERVRYARNIANWPCQPKIQQNRSVYREMK